MVLVYLLKAAECPKYFTARIFILSIFQLSIKKPKSYFVVSSVGYSFINDKVSFAQKNFQKAGMKPMIVLKISVITLSSRKAGIPMSRGVGKFLKMNKRRVGRLG